MWSQRPADGRWSEGPASLSACMELDVLGLDLLLDLLLVLVLDLGLDLVTGLVLVQDRSLDLDLGLDLMLVLDLHLYVDLDLDMYLVVVLALELDLDIGLVQDPSPSHGLVLDLVLELCPVF